MVSSADVWFCFAIGDYQSSNPERSANSIALGSTSLHLLAQLCLHLSWILVQSSDFSPALCHYRGALSHFVLFIAVGRRRRRRLVRCDHCSHRFSNLLGI